MNHRPDDEAGSLPATLPRIGLSSAVFLVVANMIGTGVFTTAGFAIGDLRDRSWVLAAWALGGVLALLGALCYGALGVRLPQSGGEYLLLARVVHPLAGFLAGWISLVAGFTAPIAAAALLIPAYLGIEGTSANLMASGVVLGAGILHALRRAQGVRVQNLVVLSKLVAIALFILYGGVWLSRHGMSPAAPQIHDHFPLSLFATTLVWVSFSYSGWNAAVYVLGELELPGRNLQRSLILGTSVVTVCYLALNAVFLYAPDPSTLFGRPDVGRIAAEALGGTGLRNALSGLILVALFTSVSSMVMVGPRVYAQMAEDGLFPRMFRIGSRGPGPAVALQSALAILVIWISEIRELLGFIGVSLGLSLSASVLALMHLRRKEGHARVPLPGYPWVPIAFVLFTLFSVVSMAEHRIANGEPGEIRAAIATLGLGVVLYFIAAGRGKPRS